METAHEQLPEPRRKEIFSALVDAQDQNMTVPESRRHVARHFQVGEEVVSQIEREGLDQGWPPLD